MQRNYESQPLDVGVVDRQHCGNCSFTLAQLFLSAQVISWLLNGLSISAYLSQLAIWISVIVVLNIIQQLLNRYISLEHEFFRIGLMYKITNVLNRQDYPLIFWKKVKRVFPNR